MQSVDAGCSSLIVSSLQKANQEIQKIELNFEKCSIDSTIIDSLKESLQYLIYLQDLSINFS